LRLIIPVSELEKNAEQTISNARISSNRPVLVSLKSYLGTGRTGPRSHGQDEFTDQFATEEGQHQQEKAGQGPANGLAAAPATHVPADRKSTRLNSSHV